MSLPSYQDALARAANTTAFQSGMCDYFVATLYGQSASGYVDARHHWLASQDQHPGDTNPPAGALVFWGSPNQGYGHVAISDGNGGIYSTDISGNGTVSHVSLGTITQKWGLPYLGWATPQFGNQFAQTGPVNVAGTPYGGTSSGSQNFTSLSPYGYTSNPTPTIDPQTMAEEYGMSWSMIQSIPELSSLFSQAVSEQWTPDRFAAALQNTQWYKTNSDTARKTITEQKVDPATYNQQVLQKKTSIQASAAAMGSMISDATAQKFAAMSIMYGWDDAYMNKVLGDYVTADAAGHFGGTAGKIEMGLRELANSNGISFDQSALTNFVKNISKGISTVEDAQGWVREQAAQKYPAYADQINKGVNLADLAQPYTQSLQKILELGPDAATLQDPTINAALTWRDAKGTPGVMPIWQFQNNLRTDPRWKGTQNAQDSLMAAGHNVLKDFGMQF